MRIAVTGSIATDHLMVFPGRFADQLIPDQLAHVSLSFLVDALEVRRGGVAANVAFGLGGLGLSPLLVGAVGGDFADYEVWLKEHGVDTGAVHVSAERQTARFMCITDEDANQIAAFYAGAMQEAGTIDLRPLTAPGADRPDLVLVCPNDPAAMVRHTAQCRELGLPFAADPSQQLARLDGPQVRDLVDGARWLFTNEYEAALLLERTGWDRETVLGTVGAWVTTLGEAGVRIDRSGHEPLTVPAVPEAPVTDPTGVGDAFRAGFLAAVARGLSLESAARLGCVVAAEALGAVGSQAYRIDPERLLATAARAYGAEAARLLAPGLGGAEDRS
ncbi:carbohydrate kinase family protein [Streptomyces sp. WAC05374]|uniref:carbohydrate kinase family protein n=1 Tax=Streptomyces sp. WAC05374 TaxID=2487420 RepID=UPI000F89548B|nr:carbohydrate kinase family protein [Streptomyces sp. WAC05374]RST05012.1 carbohydrate kinase family protein [Streptomyces sp. WAC05374]TDF39097.1 carbohydrate kinase family protein [Streptomyces sp. WAC05374]TDF47480.1 carbohydrate kinase family protein [Streptomyces sp. WAC05374]TDF48205.1 carbohydrate kinase family protein [Streptomyces sp. WAC05374]